MWSFAPTPEPPARSVTKPSTLVYASPWRPVSPLRSCRFVSTSTSATRSRPHRSESSSQRYGQAHHPSASWATQSNHTRREDHHRNRTRRREHARPRLRRHLHTHRPTRPHAHRNAGGIARHRRLPRNGTPPLSSTIDELVELRSATYTTYRASLGIDGSHLPPQFSDIVTAVIAFADRSPNPLRQQPCGTQHAADGPHESLNIPKRLGGCATAAGSPVREVQMRSWRQIAT